MIVQKNQQQFFAQLAKTFGEFLSHFEVDGAHPYVRLAREILDSHQRGQFQVNFKDIIKFSDQLAENVLIHFQRIEADLHQVCHRFVCNVLDEEPPIPIKLQLFSSNYQGLRVLKSSLIGKLMTFKGTVTLATQVHPQVRKGVFKCNYCGQISKPVIQEFKFMRPKYCKKEGCDNKDSWKLIQDMSQFDDLQRIKVQQDPTQIPPGGMPRSIQIILRDHLVQRVKPGDSAIITGYLCAAPQIYSMKQPGQKQQAVKQLAGKRGNAVTGGVSGLKMMGVRDLNYKMIFVASSIYTRNAPIQYNQEQQFESQQKYSFDPKRYIDKALKRLIPQDRQVIKQIAQDPDRYRKMANSLFPDIYGQHQIKKAILLQLFSGVHKDTDQKLRLRGDINILVVGDPSTAKSQFLKFTTDFMPRSIYTNGKTSSAAGLTASVTKDITGDYAIQAGALVLADNGICCIDQFDKMDIKDMTAIHQAMQQQTISLAKAGVNATLNTRTSILAAANPKFGRYDKSKSLRSNLDISQPIMSRFDLFFVVTDQCKEQEDRFMAQFILNKHCGIDTSSVNLYTKSMLQKYIRYGRALQPRFTKQSNQLLKESFMRLRADYKINKNTSYMITVRQLESLIRLSQALAKMNNDIWVRKEYVAQATRLLRDSIIRIDREDIQVQDYRTMPMTDMSVQIPTRHVQKLPYQQYKNLQKIIISYIKQRQNLFQESQIQFAVRQEDIINQILASRRNQMQQQDESKIRVIANAVISRMIKKDKILRLIEESKSHASRMVALHPDFLQQNL